MIKYINTGPAILEREYIELFVKSFHKDILLQLDKDQVCRVIFKVEYHGNNHRSFSKFIFVNNDPRLINLILNNIESYLDQYQNSYSDLLIINFYFEYKISSEEYKISSEDFNKITSIINDYLDNNLLQEPEINLHNKITNYKFLPCTMDLTTWAPFIKYSNDYKSAIFTQNNLLYSFKLFKNYYYLEINSSNGDILLKIKDIHEGRTLGLSNFTRIIYKSYTNKDNKTIWIRNKIFIYVEGELKYQEESSNRRFFIIKNIKNKKSK